MSIFQYLVFIVGLISFTANGAVIVGNARATPLIQHYLVQHPAKETLLVREQHRIIQQLQQWQRVSLKAIDGLIEQHQPKTALLPAFYPLHSSLLTPGRVASRRVHVDLPVPFFIVGDDVQSLGWLQQYRYRLVTLHATGFVVNVETRSAMHSLHTRFPHLSLMAIPGDALATWLGLYHYPVLISDHRIEQ